MADIAAATSPMAATNGTSHEAAALRMDTSTVSSGEVSLTPPTTVVGQTIESCGWKQSGSSSGRLAARRTRPSATAASTSAVAYRMLRKLRTLTT